MSHEVGPSQPPLLEQTIPEHFASIVAQHGDRTAVIARHQRAQLTYEALDAKSNALARGLQSAGVRKGERVAVSLGNCVEFAVATYALYKLGAVLNPLNPSLSAAQLASALNHLQASHLIIGAETHVTGGRPPRDNAAILRHIVPGIGSHSESGSGARLQSEAVPSLRRLVLFDNSAGRVDAAAAYPAAIPFAELYHAGVDSSRALSDQNLDCFDVVNIQFTSGTTSAPKAACLSHRSILNNGFSIGERLRLTPSDVVVCPPPLFHCFGSVLGYMATATHGASIVFPSEAFSAEASLRAVQEYAGTALYGVATMFLAELDLLARGVVSSAGFAHLRTGIAAGSSVPAELMRKLHSLLNLHDLTICYGMTETSPVSLMTRPDDPLDRRVSTVGTLLPHIQARVVSPSDPSQILPVGTPGQLAIAGYSVMSGYWDDPSRTAAALFPDPLQPQRKWMLTGDQAVMHDDGFVSISGRIDDLIIRGGENISPLEIENCLLASSSVAEASVVGLPDQTYGEVVAAFVRRTDPSLTCAAVRDWVRERLSRHLVPKFVFWIDDFPKTASGKIQKFKLRETGTRLVKEGEGLE